MRDTVCDYYSLVPFWRIMLFNLTLPMILRVILSASGVMAGSVLIYIAANAAFYVICRKRSEGGYEHLSGRAVFKRVIITVIADCFVYLLVGTVMAIYFFLNLGKIFPF